MGKGANALSRNPNLCSSCSSISDGMEEEEKVVLKVGLDPRGESGRQGDPVFARAQTG